MVGVRTNGRLRVEYQSNLGQHSMGNVMVFDVTLESGYNLLLINLYDQQDKEQNTAT
jgi:hypothetical protein